MQLRDVIDLEAQLAADEGQDEAALRERDRGLYRAMPSPPAAPDQLLAAWLAGLRERFGSPLLGERVTLAQRIWTYVLLLVGLLLGWGTAAGLLHYEQGGAPVNVGYYILVLGIGQLAALLALLLSLTLRARLSGLRMLGDVARLLRWLSRSLASRLARTRSSATEELASQVLALRRIQTRVGLYQPIERYLLLTQTQLFAVAFNVGALSSCLRLIFLSDLAFSWSTSLTSLDAAQVHRLCSALAAPFAWLVPEAVPTRELVEHTQYFRLEGRFAGAAPGTRGDPRLAGQWWRFLIACTVSYGLVPRALALCAFAARLRGAQRNVPLDTPLVQRVIMRLTTPALSTRGPQPGSDQAEPALSVTPAEPRTGGQTVLLLYRDIPTAPALLAQAVGEQLGLEVTSVQRAGGLDVRADVGLCRTLGEQPLPVTLVAEAWEAPDKSLRALLAQLRQALGPQRPVRVVLIGEASANDFSEASPEDVSIYADRLTLLRDPYLLVETLKAAERSEGVAEVVS